MEIEVQFLQRQWFIYTGSRKLVATTNTNMHDKSDCVQIDVDAIISIASLLYASTTKMYTLEEVDANSLNEFIANQT